MDRVLCPFLFLFLLFSGALATKFHPPSCQQTCSKASFIKRLDLEDGPVEGDSNRAYAWAKMTLIQAKLNFASLSPPQAGRVCAIVGTCLYEAAAFVTEGYGSSVGHSYEFPKVGSDMLKDVIDGAGYWSLKMLFGEFASYKKVFSQYRGFAGKDLEDLAFAAEYGAGYLDEYTHYPFADDNAPTRKDAIAAGAFVCQKVIEHYTSDGYTPNGSLGNAPNSIGYASKNLPQTLGGVTDCHSQMTFVDRWQPICVPKDSFAYGTPDCEEQKFIAPHATRYTPFALEEGDEHSGGRLVPPPPEYGTPEFESNYTEVLKISGELDDVKKVVAEYWADGPDTTMPAGHAWTIAADAAFGEGLSEEETAKLLFIVGNAVYDAGIASWRTKVTYDFVRPLQMIQCGKFSETIQEAWMGPYLGVGPIDVSKWRPYQSPEFVSPGFAAYVSGHSTFSAAGAEVLRLFFDDDQYKGPACDIVYEGESIFEPKSYEIPGLTDVPNQGPYTEGYTPAEDVVLCWDSWSSTAEQSGMSRLYGGIHISADNVQGLALGRSVGKAVYRKAIQLMKN